MRVVRSIRHVSAVVLLVGGLSVVGMVSGAGFPPMAEAAASAPPVTFDGPVDIGHGRTIFLHCEGTGSPTVVLESGYHDNGALWSEADRAAGAISRPFGL